MNAQEELGNIEGHRQPKWEPKKSTRSKKTAHYVRRVPEDENSALPRTYFRWIPIKGKGKGDRYEIERENRGNRKGGGKRGERVNHK